MTYGFIVIGLLRKPASFGPGETQLFSLERAPRKLIWKDRPLGVGVESSYLPYQEHVMIIAWSASTLFTEGGAMHIQFY